MKYCFYVLLFTFLNLNAQVLLKPDRVFDGTELHENWVVVVTENQISYVGAAQGANKIKTTIDLTGTTLMPGIIEGHSHVLLHPYNETDWNDQVLKESSVERAIRGTIHVKNSLLAGVTTMRDLGAEGAGYTDVYLKKLLIMGLSPGQGCWLRGRQ